MTASNPMVYQSDTKDVILLDLPRSIEDAQSSPCQVRSTTPLAQPFPSTEPKGVKRLQALAAIGTERLKQTSDLEELILEALSQIHRHVAASNCTWCYPRSVGQSLDMVELRNEKGETSPYHTVKNNSLPHPPIVLSSTERCTAFSGVSDVCCAAVYNPQLCACISVGGTVFLIPPNSTFTLSTIQEAECTLNASSWMPKFDLILMDPPWSNRSVRRKQSYSTDEMQPENVFMTTLPFLRQHLNPQGIVAIWITNKVAIETQVLQAMATLGLFVQQEWIWIKITSSGVPITDLHGVWRKPYERLLLYGHRPSQPVKRRIIAAIPDVHSRKPSLKRLFDEVLPADYQALELFARSLTAGWWSWGDQVLHFQQIQGWDHNHVLLDHPP